MVEVKKFEVPDIQPVGFIIEIVDEEKKPIAGTKFSVVVDEGSETIIETNENGLLKVLKPKSEIKLSLAEEESMGPIVEEAETPLQSQESIPLMTTAEYQVEGQTSKQNSMGPYESEVPFADIPPAGYWPVRTSRKEGRQVAYAYKADGKLKFEGLKGRRFLADRGSDRYHVGVDIFADFDDPVVACEDGKIVNFYCFKFSKPEKREDECKSGEATYALLVEHSNVVINYGEVAKDSLDREVAKDKKHKLKKGDKVKAGDIIGYVGRNPGGSSMLHFETYKKGTTKNARWKKNEKTPPSALRDPTKYLLFLKEKGLSGTEKQQNFDYNVPGIVPIIAQPSGMTCWATVATMMVSWRDKTSYAFQEVMDMAGPVYRAKFDNNEGLLGSEKDAFLTALGLAGEPPMSYIVSGLKSLLEKHGPLWATTDERPGAGFSIHARIITGIFGDGTIDGTSLRINDPAGGRQYTETFKKFIQKYEEVTETGNLRVQIVHF